MAAPEPNSEVRDDTSYGVISLDLAPDGYAWQFHPVAGQTFTDSGVASCVAFEPELSVASPASGAVFAVGAPIEFAGSASDVEEGDLGANLVWRSNRDGEIGVGSAFTHASLSCGGHLVTVSVADLHGGSDEATLTLQIGPAGCVPPPACGLGPDLLVPLGLLALASASRRVGSRRR
jgi:hypothetical protein